MTIQPSTPCRTSPGGVWLCRGTMTSSLSRFFRSAFPKIIASVRPQFDLAHMRDYRLSLELSSVCVVDTQGKIVKEAKVASDPEDLTAFFASLGFVVKRIGLEAGPLSQWLSVLRPIDHGSQRSRFSLLSISRHFAATPDVGRFRTEADMNRQARPAASVANDPSRKSWPCVRLGCPRVKGSIMAWRPIGFPIALDGACLCMDVAVGCRVLH
jgi:hypothetical protein